MTTFVERLAARIAVLEAERGAGDAYVQDLKRLALELQRDIGVAAHYPESGAIDWALGFARLPRHVWPEAAITATQA